MSKHYTIAVRPTDHIEEAAKMLAESAGVTVSFIYDDQPFPWEVSKQVAISTLISQFFKGKRYTALLAGKHLLNQWRYCESNVRPVEVENSPTDVQGKLIDLVGNHPNGDIVLGIKSLSDQQEDFSINDLVVFLTNGSDAAILKPRFSKEHTILDFWKACQIAALEAIFTQNSWPNNVNQPIHHVKWCKANLDYIS